MGKLKVTQVRSSIGTKPNQRKNLRALGLRKMSASRIHEDNPIIRGIINKVHHLVKVEEVKQRYGDTIIMESQYTIKKPVSHKERSRVGRGTGSGSGKTCGRGMNGQKSRSGYSSRPGFEGGQMPLQRRVPKRGFNNIFKKNYQIVNVSDLDRIASEEITVQSLVDAGLVDSISTMVKILGNGEVKKKMRVYADAFSQPAIEKIAKAGGETVHRDVRAEVSAANSGDQA